MKITPTALIALLFISAMPAIGSEYQAVGKVAVNFDGLTPIPKEFISTQIEILEGGELRRRAIERIRAIHPEYKEIDVKISCSQAKESWIIVVTALGEEPKYTRGFLNGLLDEYIALRKENSERGLSSSLSRIIEEVLSREKIVKEKTIAVEEFRNKNDIEILEALRERARRIIIEENDDKKVEGAVAKMKMICAQLSPYQILKEELNRANESYREWKSALDKTDLGSVPHIDLMSIIERPMIAVQLAPKFPSR